MEIKDYCYICGLYTYCNPHHLIEGIGRRKLSDKYGLVVNACFNCHRDIHDHPERYLYLKKEAQQFAMKQYSWSIQDWINKFGKNYL